MELRAGHAQFVEKGAATLDAARVEHQAQVAKLQARITELVEEKLQAQSMADQVKIVHEQAEHAWEQQMCETGKRCKEIDTQREQTLQHETEAAMLRRLEVTWLRTELEDLRTRSAQDLEEVRCEKNREKEHHEARERSATEDRENRALKVRELEAKLGEAEIQQVRLKASLVTVEKEEARSSSTLDFLRPELAACEAIAQRERDARKSEDATHLKLERDLLAEVQEAVKQKSTAQSALEDSEVARHHVTQEYEQSQREVLELSRSYKQEQLRVSELDGSMRQRLELIDREVSDLSSLRSLLASADGLQNTSVAQSVESFLDSFNSPRSPTKLFS